MDLKLYLGELFERNISSKFDGSCFLVNLNMKIKTWNIFKFLTLKIFKFSITGIALSRMFLNLIILQPRLCKLVSFSSFVGWVAPYVILA